MIAQTFYGSETSKEVTKLVKIGKLTVKYLNKFVCSFLSCMKLQIVAPRSPRKTQRLLLSPLAQQNDIFGCEKVNRMMCSP